MYLWNCHIRDISGILGWSPCNKLEFRCLKKWKTGKYISKKSKFCFLFKTFWKYSTTRSFCCAGIQNRLSELGERCNWSFRNLHLMNFALFFLLWTKEGRKTQNPWNVQFSNFKWTVLRAPWTVSNDQGRKMTAFVSGFNIRFSKDLETSSLILIRFASNLVRTNFSTK